MTDLPRLREALKWHAEVPDTAGWSHPFHVIREAACAYVDLLENGERKWLCQEAGLHPKWGQPQTCYFTGGAHYPDCGWVRLVPDPEEA